MLRRTILAAILLAAAPAGAHDWYPVDCCSGQDCRPRPCDVLEEQRDGGVRDVELGQTYSREQVRPSHDGQCHVCTGAGAPDGRPICAFTVLGS